jgi:uncharacterized surface protein with fasciclin (FAS1) repeats
MPISIRHPEGRARRSDRSADHGSRLPGDRRTAALVSRPRTMTTLDTFTKQKLTVSDKAGVITINGAAHVLVPDIQTANATVYLIDSVMIPPSVG